MSSQTPGRSKRKENGMSFILRTFSEGGHTASALFPLADPWSHGYTKHQKMLGNAVLREPEPELSFHLQSLGSFLLHEHPLFSLTWVQCHIGQNVFSSGSFPPRWIELSKEATASGRGMEPCGMLQLLTDCHLPCEASPLHGQTTRLTDLSQAWEPISFPGWSSDNMEESPESHPMQFSPFFWSSLLKLAYKVHPTS